MATKLIIGVNDLLTINPSLASEWDYEKNEGLRPEKVTSGSSKKVWWRGQCGHRWPATIASRNKGVGCPFCAKKRINKRVSQAILKKRGSLLETNPLLAEEWHPTRNSGVSPEDVTAGSHRVVWWRGKCGHEWQSTIRDRNRGSGCPLCTKEVVIRGFNDLPTVFPNLAHEWDINKNLISIESVTGGSLKQVWWKCKKGHSWRMSPKARAKGKGCPICSGKTYGLKKYSLLEIRPDIAKEWHPELNKWLKPGDIAVGSHQKVWWKCVKGHEWQASPNHRTSKERGCPYCCANPMVLPGVNDLATLRPDLAKEWNLEKNGILSPKKVTVSSSKSVWWNCSLGHEWKTAINHRSDGSGCPKCAKGMQTSFPEQAIFYYVSQSYPDAINGYTDLFNNHGMELDIFIPSIKTGIEYDGIAFHRKKTQVEREKRKYEICKKSGIKLIRIREDINNTTSDSSDFVILLRNGLDDGIRELNQFGISVTNINAERDRNVIDACYRASLDKNSLEHIYPQIAKDWNKEKNGVLTPSMFFAKSNRKVWWKCNLGHEWEATIDSRVRGTGCPYCSNNRILSGYNDLASRRPDLLAEWDYEKNTLIDPTTVAPGSGKKAWWICKMGHSWQAEISSRNKNHGCPYCAKVRKLGKNTSR